MLRIGLNKNSLSILICFFGTNPYQLPWSFLSSLIMIDDAGLSKRSPMRVNDGMGHAGR